MKPVISLFLLSLFCWQLQAQSDISLPSSRTSIIRILADGEIIANGILYDVTDSAVVILSADSNLLQNWKYDQITEIRMRKKSAPAIGAVVGGGSGLIVGLLIDGGKQTGQQSASADEASFTPTFSVILTLVGAAAGAAIGSWWKKLKIDGDHLRFEQSRKTLEKHLKSDS